MMTDENQPVTNGQCRLKHALIEQRFGTLEGDMREVKRNMSDVKRDVGEMKNSLAIQAELTQKFQNTALEYGGWTLKIVAIVLILVAAGRGLDLSGMLG
jgi:hypothetical protein